MKVSTEHNERMAKITLAIRNAGERDNIIRIEY